MLTIEDAIKELKDASDREVRYGDTNNHYYEIMMRIEAFDMAIKVLEQTMWIPVSKELPEEYIHVLCQFYMGGMAECYHAHGAWHIVGGYRISCDEVVAWMPLPEPYRSENE